LNVEQRKKEKEEDNYVTNCLH